MNITESDKKDLINALYSQKKIYTKSTTTLSYSTYFNIEFQVMPLKFHLLFHTVREPSTRPNLYSKRSISADKRRLYRQQLTRTKRLH